MKDYFPVSMPRYSRYRQRLRASRTVHFPNDVIFQDHIRQGDLEQVGRFIRTRKVALDTIYPSGECCELQCHGLLGAAQTQLGSGLPMAAWWLKSTRFPSLVRSSAPSRCQEGLREPCITAPAPPLSSVVSVCCRKGETSRGPARHSGAPTQQPVWCDPEKEQECR